ncbi:hypothetical protein [Diplocloster modestus]|uniref:Uncharacterized protein n=1 Tax=Diplocloster modestus TaxID=2850322 RepID=A0ABS6K908_9FIRM|nr:hypothetical protein [Diplocloster modestus]MBU9726991.1 hypothetical protein [Diplocloster modestus]
MVRKDHTIIDRTECRDSIGSGGPSHIKEILQQFRNPGKEYYARPFWAWNGKLEEQELLRQIDIMREMDRYLF